MRESHVKLSPRACPDASVPKGMAILSGVSAPHQPSMKQKNKKIQKNHFATGRNLIDRTFEVSSQGSTNKTTIAPNISTIPRSLSGTARNIA